MDVNKPPADEPVSRSASKVFWDTAKRVQDENPEDYEGWENVALDAVLRMLRQRAESAEAREVFRVGFHESNGKGGMKGPRGGIAALSSFVFGPAPIAPEVVSGGPETHPPGIPCTCEPTRHNRAKGITYRHHPPCHWHVREMTAAERKAWRAGLSEEKREGFRARIRENRKEVPNLADRRLATLDAIAKTCDEAGIETFPRRNDYSDLIERVRLLTQCEDCSQEAVIRRCDECYEDNI